MMYIYKFLLCSLLVSSILCSDVQEHVALYQTLDPHSLSQLSAFCLLHSDSVKGKQSFQKLLKLLGQDGSKLSMPPEQLCSLLLTLEGSSRNPKELLTAEEVAIIRMLSSHFLNKKLTGYRVYEEAFFWDLAEKQFDLGSSLLAELFIKSSEDKKRHIIEHYDALLDLMALHIFVQLSEGATDQEKVEAITNYLFHEQGFCFPSRSHFQEGRFSMLSSVIDQKCGVCLGVSLVYMCLAQRLGVSLEAITPPGHIYLRYHTGNGVRNIEPTARGIHMPCETYQSMQEPSLPLCSLKGMVGLALTNQAASYLQEQQFPLAAWFYERGLKYFSENLFMKVFYAFSQLFTPGREEEGEKLLKSLPAEQLPMHVKTLQEDWLARRLNLAGLKSFLSLDFSNRQKLYQMEKVLWNLLQCYPESHACILAYGELELHLQQKAIAYKWFKKYLSLAPKNGLIAYRLAELAYDKLDYAAAWEYLEQSVLLTKTQPQVPGELKALYVLLQQQSPKTSSVMQEILDKEARKRVVEGGEPPVEDVCTG